ncbi:MAG TPA: T9SS type A sorting domain-containing protein [Bacteroidetes bacterium]|nr:T9SS type A sorting domain-containing protein [Bacteroidota bacterium]
MKKIALQFLPLSMLLMSFSNAFGQRCLTSHVRDANIADNPAILERVKAIEKSTQKWIREQYQPNAKLAPVTIPVVVHVLWRLPDENISDEQIQSQIDVLNEDFRKLNGNLSSTPAAFLGLAADVELEFCLATTDPNGNPTNGITRTQTDVDDIGMTQDYFDEYYGGKSAWDISRYVNIWVCDIGDDGTLGFATPPGTADPAESDGLVIGHQFFGTTGTAANSSPNHLGRTTTHEMGHYFNLEHLWGPGDGGCNEDDFVDDTPLQFTESNGCPTFPLTDQCTASGDGILYVNYMDYTDDDCMTIFTEGQKARMLAALNGPRSSLLDSPACTPATAVTEQGRPSFEISPNPASGELNIVLKNNKLRLVALELLNGNGKVVRRQAADQATKTTMPLDQVPAGFYFLKLIGQSGTLTKKVCVVKN